MFNRLPVLDIQVVEVVEATRLVMRSSANYTNFHCSSERILPRIKRSPFITSGVRIGTPAITSRGMKEKDMEKIASWIARIIKGGETEAKKVQGEVIVFMKDFPLYQ